MAERLTPERISIAAVGDISFQGRHADQPTPEPFGKIAQILHSMDMVIGNLECPLVDGETHLPSKCCLRGSPKWAAVLKESGFGVLSLANNHIMDYGQEGLFQTIEALDSAGILYLGAGKTIEQANAPLILECSGEKIALLARSNVIVRSPCYAREQQPGAAFLNEQELIVNLEECKRVADTVILLIHWGMEEYLFPSPEQRMLSEKFAKAGADLILGHHPHVLQGIERVNNSLVAYSLGNFLFDEFEWDYIAGDGNQRRIYSGLSPENREGVILKIEKPMSQKDLHYQGIYTKIDDNCNIIEDIHPPENVRLQNISKYFSKYLYNPRWHVYSMKKEWDLRLRYDFSLDKIRKNIFKLRFRHFRETFASIRRSLKIAFGKSTNPYD